MTLLELLEEEVQGFRTLCLLWCYCAWTKRKTMQGIIIKNAICLSIFLSSNLGLKRFFFFSRWVSTNMLAVSLSLFFSFLSCHFDPDSFKMAKWPIFRKGINAPTYIHITFIKTSNINKHWMSFFYSSQKINTCHPTIKSTRRLPKWSWSNLSFWVCDMCNILVTITWYVQRGIRHEKKHFMSNCWEWTTKNCRLSTLDIPKSNGWSPPRQQNSLMQPVHS